MPSCPAQNGFLKVFSVLLNIFSYGFVLFIWSNLSSLALHQILLFLDEPWKLILWSRITLKQYTLVLLKKIKNTMHMFATNVHNKIVPTPKLIVFPTSNSPKLKKLWKCLSFQKTIFIFSGILNVERPRVSSPLIPMHGTSHNSHIIKTQLWLVGF